MYQVFARASAVGACLLFAACATTSPEPQSGPAAGTVDVLPPNYRELIVQVISDRTDVRAIQSARISQQTELWMGVLLGGNRRAICVETSRKTLLNSDAREVWAITFKNGRIDMAAPSPYAKCEGYSPFNDLMERSAKARAGRPS